MNQEIVSLISQQPTKIQTHSPPEMKLQLFQKKDQQKSQTPCKENNSKHKNQTLNQQLQSEESESDCDSSDVSFQDDILQSHYSALNLQIAQNESLFALQNSQTKNTKTIIKLSFFYDNLHTTLKALPNAQFQLVQAFCFFIQHNHVFKRFLEHIHYSFNHSVSNKLLQLSFMVWNLYRPLFGIGLNKPEIFMIINNISRILCVNQNIFRRRSTQLMTPQNNIVRQSFINFFVTTLLFVLEGFFKNPLSSPPAFEDGRTSRCFEQIGYQQGQNYELAPQCRKMVKTDLK